MTPKSIFESISAAGIEEVPERFGGPGFRCATWLTDGTYLPCVLVQRIGPVADLRSEQMQAELRGEGGYRLWRNPVREAIKTNLKWSNRVAATNIERVEQSRYATPLSLLEQVRGETAMSLWLFALETKEGRRLSFCGAILQDLLFLDLPSDVEFNDFSIVHNVRKSRQPLPSCEGSYNPRPYFECFVDDEPINNPDLSSLGFA